MTHAQPPSLTLISCFMWGGYVGMCRATRFSSTMMERLSRHSKTWNLCKWSELHCIALHWLNASLFAQKTKSIQEVTNQPTIHRHHFSSSPSQYSQETRMLRKLMIAILAVPITWQCRYISNNMQPTGFMLPSGIFSSLNSLQTLYESHESMITWSLPWLSPLSIWTVTQEYEQYGIVILQCQHSLHSNQPASYSVTVRRNEIIFILLIIHMEEISSYDDWHRDLSSNNLGPTATSSLNGLNNLISL